MMGATEIGRIASAAAMATVFAAAAPALAADAASGYSPWAGFYAGVVYGAGVSSVHSSGTTSRNATGWGQTSGSLIGYDFQYGRMVIGGEGELSFHLLRPNVSGGTGLQSHVVDTPVTERLRLRLGYDAGAFLPFFAVGVASARIYEAGDTWPNVAYGETRQTAGLSLGAGLEWRFAAPILGPLVVRGEYVADIYPTQTFTNVGSPGAAPIRTRAIEQFFRIGLIDYIDPSWRPSAGVNAGAFDWSGPYAGVTAGGMWARPHNSLAGASTTDSAAGPLGGVFAGRSFQFGRWVAGWEGAVEVTNVTGTGPQPYSPGTTHDVRYRNYFEADARLRAGYAFGRILPYVTAGLDWGRSEQTDLATGSYRGRIWSDSVAAGGGVEYAFDDRWTARLEYLYSWSYDHNSTQLDALAIEQTRPATTLRAGLAYYFH